VDRQQQEEDGKQSQLTVAANASAGALPLPLALRLAIAPDTAHHAPPFNTLWSMCCAGCDLNENDICFASCHPSACGRTGASGWCVQQCEYSWCLALHMHGDRAAGPLPEQVAPRAASPRCSVGWRAAGVMPTSAMGVPLLPAVVHHPQGPPGCQRCSLLYLRFILYPVFPCLSINQGGHESPHLQGHRS